MNSKAKKGYRYCFVPGCKSTSIKTPNKRFIVVPRIEKVRKTWFKVSRRDHMGAVATRLDCCEDHFKVEEDCSNLVKHNLTGCRLKLKDNILPHVFDCQPDRKRAHSMKERSYLSKKRKNEMIDECLNNNSHSDEPTLEDMEEALDDQTPQSLDKGIQVKKSYRSIGIQAVRITATKGCSPIKKPRRKTKIRKNFEIHQELPPESTSSDTQSEESYSGANSEEDINASDTEYEVSSQTDIISLCNKYSKLYLGIWPQQMHIIDIISSYTSLCIKDIYITLMKIKLDDSFERLGHQFNLSKVQVSKIFSRSLPLISQCLNSLVFFTRHYNKIALPIAFRANYSKVVAIIDCFEIEIEKPSNPIKQSQTWSEYKSCNTIKYLVSCTPNGCVQFVSPGYGGRITDKRIVEVSGFLEKLPNDVKVMADRGFKNIEELLMKGCQLVRPPTVMAKIPASKKDVMKSKRIAALRIHVERLIKRFREFKILKPHSVVNHSLIGLLDDMVIVAAGLINIQRKLLKK